MHSWNWSKINGKIEHLSEDRERKRNGLVKISNDEKESQNQNGHEKLTYTFIAWKNWCLFI